MKKKLILTLTDVEVIAELIDTSAKKPIVARRASIWRKGGLSSVIETVLQDFNSIKEISILLSSDLYHITGIQVENGQSSDRDFIRLKASETIIEDLSTTHWDYAVVSKDQTISNIQVFCLTKRIEDELNQLNAKISNKVTSILPLSYVLMSMFEEKDTSFILLYSDGACNSITVCRNGLVVYSTSFNPEELDQKVVTVVEYAKTHLNFTSNLVVLAGVKPGQSLSKQLEGFEFATVELQASVGFALMGVPTGRDKNVLNISLSSPNSGILDDVVATRTLYGQTKHRNWKFIIILSITALLGLAVGVLLIV